MVCKQFLTNFNSGHVHDGLRDFVKATIGKKETAMTELSSSTQILFFILFQIGFRLIAEPIELFTKVFLFVLVDVLMVLVVVSEWFQQKCEWDLWVQKVSG